MTDVLRRLLLKQLNNRSLSTHTAAATAAKLVLNCRSVRSATEHQPCRNAIYLLTRGLVTDRRGRWFIALRMSTGTSRSVSQSQ